MNEVIDWFVSNKEWLFSGVGVVIVIGIWRAISKGRQSSLSQSIQAGKNSTNVQAGHDANVQVKSIDTDGK